jgi:hypothetical protein
VHRLSGLAVGVLGAIPSVVFSLPRGLLRVLVVEHG